MRTAAIRAIATHLPAHVVTNEDLCRDFDDWTPEKIFEKTGIRSRHIAAASECSSDLGVAAAEALFARGLDRGTIDYLVFCTQTPDYLLPATACLVQDRLGLATRCGAIDLNQGCSGFVYGLSVAKGLVESGSAERVLLITADTYSKLLNRRDRSVRTLFGDGAAATLIGAVDAPEPMIGPFVFGTDGRGAENLIVRAGGMREPLLEIHRNEERDESGNWRSAANLYMNGAEIFTFTLSAVPAAIRDLLAQAQITMEDVDWFVLHQANGFMLERLRLKLKIAPERFAIEMEACGNTVSSTIPLALSNKYGHDTRIGSPSRVMLVGFGVGYSWAAAMARVGDLGGNA